MANSKSRDEADVLAPAEFHPPSNGEFCPGPPSLASQQAERAWRALVEAKHKRLGMSRRQFAESACGHAAWLLAFNQIACGTSTSSKNGGVPDAAPFDVTPDMAEDRQLADAAMAVNDFIFDVQLHPSTPLQPWDGKRPPDRAIELINLIFVQSDTTVGCISGVPDARNLGAANVDANAKLKALMDSLAGPRLLFHANAKPENGRPELDYIAELANKHKIAAWKTYPWQHPTARFDSDVGMAFIERARAVGVNVICAHRGISGGGGYGVPGSPADVVRAAKGAPDVRFLVYHSGWEFGYDEAHPYDPSAPEHFGVDRFIRALKENGIGPTGNVYAELGSTWRNLMTAPDQATHFFGKLLAQLGPDRIVWGTDAVFNDGSPNMQILAFRNFKMTQAIREAHGYSDLTPEVKRKILGLNGAAVYGVDPEAMRRKFSNDDVEALKTAYRYDRRSIPTPDRREYVGPRNRREFLALLRRAGGHHA